MSTLADPKCITCGGHGYTLGPSGSHDCDCVRERMNEQARTEQAERKARACPVCELPKPKAEDLVCASCWALVPTPDQDELRQLRRSACGSDAHRIKCNAVVRDADRRRADLAVATP